MEILAALFIIFFFIVLSIWLALVTLAQRSYRETIISQGKLIRHLLNEIKELKAK